MKVRFYCYIPYCSDGTPMQISRTALPINVPDDVVYQYCSFLLSALNTDFQETSHCDLVLQKIAQIEAGEIKEYTDGGDGFYHYIKPDSVTFEHYVFNECPEWPLWSCSLAQYKAALAGWCKFIDMPKSIDSELIVELPDDPVSTTIP